MEAFVVLLANMNGTGASPGGEKKIGTVQSVVLRNGSSRICLADCMHNKYTPALHLATRQREFESPRCTFGSTASHSQTGPACAGTTLRTFTTTIMQQHAVVGCVKVTVQTHHVMTEPDESFDPAPRRIVADPGGAGGSCSRRCASSTMLPGQ
jgi:hypothetical protein